MEPYSTSLQHVLAELERIDLLIRAQVQRARQTVQEEGELQGLYISEQEVDALLTGPAGMPRWSAVPLRPDVEEALAHLAREIAERKAASAGLGIELRLAELARRFALAPFDIDVLLVTLAPEVDLRYERLFAYLQDDVTRRRPSVDLVLNLLCPTFAAKLAARARLTARAPLVRHRLIELFDDPSRPQPPLLGRSLRADARVVSFLFGGDLEAGEDFDARLAPFAHCMEPAAQLDDLVQEAELKSRLRALAALPLDGGSAVLYLQGPYGVGKETTAEALCRELGLRLLAVDLERLLAADEATFETALDLAGREAVLQQAALFWRGFDLLLTDDRAGRRGRFLAALEERRGLTFLTGETDWEPADALHGAAFTRIELPPPGYHERLELWRRAFRGAPGEESLDLEALAIKFRFTGGQIRDSAATARSLARVRDSRSLEEADLYSACRLQSNRRLAALAQKITPRYKWTDIVLPAGRLEQLREICNTLRHRSRVYEDWGFGARLALGKGLNVLFAGPSGTGKTMAAEVIAGELGLDLYKIDLSSVVSKYIGETEKNLSKIFSEGRASNAVLFFDEADAIFGKRTEVRDAHDRYANIEVSYLLQRMEEYEGMVILASNLRKNMDDAFVRRLHFSIEFPFPTDADRRRIWDGLWPADLPRGADLDLGFMARRFEIPGGNIKNIALAAAFLAAADGGVVTMAHLIRATQREYQKMGKVVLAGEFGEYARLTEAI